ncbi:hypothetical protein QUH24_28935, partial [Klebsiella pneumoniae]|nr:hypothetical protein [Klebsiella pneumoniae]
ASALKPTFPQILLHNIAIVDAARQLDQRQVDLLIDTHLHSGQRRDTMANRRSVVRPSISLPAIIAAWVIRLKVLKPQRRSP